MIVLRRALGFSVIATLFVFLPARAQAQAQTRVSRVAGEVTLQLTQDGPVESLTGSRPVTGDARVRTGPSGIASIRYPGGTEVTVKPNSEVRVGGDQGEGIWVWLGSILVRARRLLSTEASLEVRTPVAVAAIRGTEFGVYVDETTRSQVYVFEGRVGVSNVQFPEQEVVVKEGEMTTIEPLRPPAPPTAFQPEEFDRLGRMGGLERGEDPVLESSEDPASESYLAFPDPDIDALRNPAYLGESSTRSSTTLLSGYGLKSRDYVETAGSKFETSRISGRGVTGQHVTIFPADRYRLGFSLGGDIGRDDATVVLRPPLQVTPEVRQRLTHRRTGSIEAMAARVMGGMTAGVGGSYYRSRLEVDDTLPDATVESTVTRNRASSVNAGIVFRAGDGSLGLVYTHEFLKSTAESGSLAKRIDGGNNIVEGLYRGRRGEMLTAGLLRVERVSTSEDVLDAGALFYHEDRKVSGIKGGPGIGLIRGNDLVVGLDLVGGISKETAVQRFEDGSIREDEDDRRISAAIHAGSQILLTPSLMLIADVTHQMEWIKEDFLFLPGTPNEAREEHERSTFLTSAVTGIAFVRPMYQITYSLVSSLDGSLPFSHHLTLIVDAF